jgi:hypothetical protein
MSFDIKSFAEQTRPSQRRPSPGPFDGSILDAGSPQYVRPEDLFLTIQSEIFDLPREKKESLSGIDPANFEQRWRGTDFSENDTIQLVGSLSKQELVEPLLSLLRCPKQKNANFPTLLPLRPTVGLFKNITHNLPYYLKDQLIPALCFGDEVGFGPRINLLRQRLIEVTPNDTLHEVAAALLPGNVDVQRVIPQHQGPLIKSYANPPGFDERLQSCRGFNASLDALLDLAPYLPRIVFIRWLTGLIRVWLPMVFLSRCGVTQRASTLLLNTLQTAQATPADLATEILLCPERLLRGCPQLLNQLVPLIQRYVRARLEFSIFLDLCNIYQHLALLGFDPSDPANHAKAKSWLNGFTVTPTQCPPLPPNVGILDSNKISMPGDTGAGRLPLDELLAWCAANLKGLDATAKLIGAPGGSADLLERTYSLLRPDYEPLRKSTFGRNAYWFVLYTLSAPSRESRDADFPDEFNLLVRGEGAGKGRQFMVEPGSDLLRMLVQIVHYHAERRNDAVPKLSDLIDTFEQIGVDFRSNPDDFENLKERLQKLSLLHTSADAAEAASLKPFYAITTRC